MSTLSTTNIKHPSSASNNIVLDSSGRVGIGTASPGRIFQVADSSNAFLSAKCGSVEGFVNVTATQVNLESSAGIPVTISPGGTLRGEFDTSGNLKFNSGYGSVATAYGCRAWINFNGTGAISIRDSKGVSSLTDNGTGNYNVNLSITLPDTNGVVLGNKHHSTSPSGLEGLAGASFIDTSTLRILSGDWTNTYINSNLYDSPYLMAAIIR